jgi:alginate O-acetyltransferase complex protein AlgJ
MGVRSMLSASRTADKSPSLNWPSLAQDRSWRGGADTAQPSSGMLRRYRRLFAVGAFLLLATPLAVGILRPDSPELIYKEGRRLAPPPAPPDGLKDWAVLPGQIDAYLKDHFGFRHMMIQLHKDLTKPMLGFGGSEVLIGRDGRMFYLGGEMVRQSSGLILRDQKVADSANLLAGMRDALEKQGIAFFVVVLPSTSSIYEEDLPIWAQSQGRKTEYDLFLQDLAERGIKTVDLRPTLKETASEGKTYLLHDSHWTARGAVAGFNAAVEADSHPDWRVDPAKALGPPQEIKGGDLARLIGEQDEVTETAEPLALPAGGKQEILSQDLMPAHMITSGKPGPTILVVGDSFTAGSFPSMLAQHVGRAIWVHYNTHGCSFDWSLIDKYHPDEVWWAPVERALICESRADAAAQAELR